MAMVYWKENNAMKEIGIKICHKVKALLSFKMDPNTKVFF